MPTIPPTDPERPETNNPIDFSMVLASAVHDMKNSLGMFLQSLDEFRSDLPGQYTETRGFNTLQYEAERIHNDLVQLLGLYRLGEQTLSATVEEHFLPDFIHQHIARHKPLLNGLGIGYDIESEDMTGYFDDHLVTGVLNNVINNAIRYTSGKIRLAAYASEGYLVISVEDDGVGYPSHMQHQETPNLQTLDFSSGSTSLGLYFASTVAQLHHDGDRKGFIRLHNQSDLGGGRFELWLP
ncbi:signal transduction histidine kinase [Tamilnaduibacter salinus]|uniref:Signal transduction histidine kinase n=1 Tax=Tamilnaduibacter salinus TaxID=1484056 RepID=A0A2U1CT14_9GAMM|nr:HAMP domain-containing sensor histidine kinase [Tamilnaduibacter salinus]PVY69600.1 signal transduction histidine kinase [Tamilnaduibacter salinus]